MKFRKSILLGVAAIAVSLGGAETSIQAKNLPSFASSYWYKARTVHVRHAVYASQINPKTWSVRQRKVLKSGTRIRIYNSANLGWVVKSSNLHHSSGYTWVVKGHYNTKWIKK